MTFTIELTPEESARVEKAQAHGVDVSALIRRVIDELPEKAEAEAEIETWRAKKLRELREDDALGVWQDRPETSEELAREFQALAMRRGAFFSISEAPHASVTGRD